MASRCVYAVAPVRVLDAGGWTDTWFARRGVVCSLAVGPVVQVRASMGLAGAREPMIELTVADFGDRYRFAIGDVPGRHPLLEAAIGRGAPPGHALEIDVRSTVPPGSGLGTSASVVVALLGALWALDDRPLERAAVAAAAHRVETDDLQWQSGVQDQLAASHGGASLITVGPYPESRVDALELAAPTWEFLERRLLTVYLGRPHRSSAVHDQIIARLASVADRERLLEPLRRAAHESAAALVAGDLDAYGAAMLHNTAAQEALHVDLISDAARAVIAVAAAHGAAGWKVNGAGGQGGSITVVGPEDPSRLADALHGMQSVELLSLPPDRDGLRVETA